MSFLSDLYCAIACKIVLTAELISELYLEIVCLELLKMLYYELQSSITLVSFSTIEFASAL